MEIALDIDVDVLETASDLAEDEGGTVGAVISRWARRGFLAERAPVTYPDGFKPFPRRPGEPLVTLEHVNSVQEQLDAEDALRAMRPDRDP